MFKNFDPKLPYLGKFGPKIENALFSMKICTKFNLRVLISNPVPDFNNFYCKLPHLVIFGPKIENPAFSKKIVTKTNLRVDRFQIRVLDFKNFHPKLRYLSKLVHKIKIAPFSMKIDKTQFEGVDFKSRIRF